MAPAWGAGITVTTTGLNQQEKQAVKKDVEAAGGRYSPNLSKRTTHLVTPDVVGSLSDKLTAAAAAGSRFSAHIVSLGWVSASATSSGKAAEVEYAPALPGTQQTPASCSEPVTPAIHLSSASSTQHVRSVVSAAAPTPGAAAAAAAATAAPQTPWVVHFSQMVDDSVYGMPEQPSPTAHVRLAEQLQEQQYQEQQLLLQPIAEEQSQDVSPAPACLPLQQHAAPSPRMSPAAAATAVYGMLQQQEAAMADVQRTPAAAAVTNAQRTSAAAAGASTPRSHVQSTLQQCPTALPFPGVGHVLGASCAQHTAAAAAAAFQQHPAETSKADKSRAAFGGMMNAPAAAIDRLTRNIPELMMNIAGNGYSIPGNAAASDINSGVTGDAAVQHAVPNGYRDNTAAAATGVPAPATVQPQVHEMLGEVQQQGWQQQLHQPALADVSGGCGSVEELISALRRVTADGRRSTSEFTASPVPAVTPAAAAAAAPTTPGHGHFSPIQQQQQQMQTPATRGASAAGVGVVPAFGSKRHMNSTVDELIGALQRVADSSSRSTEETASDAGGTGFPSEPQHQQGAAADGTLFGSFSSVDDLIVALRRATSDNATTAAAAQGTPQGSRHPITPLPQQQQQQQQRWPWEQAATTPQQQQDVQQRSAYAAECPVPVTPSNVDELILAMRRVTGDSRRSTAEAAPSSPGVARWEPQQLWIGQQQGGLQARALQAGSQFGSCGSVDDLLGALRRATGDSRRGTADSAPDVPAGTDDTAAAVAAGVVTANPKAGAPATMTAAAAAGGSAELSGSFGSVDDLLSALQRATADSRRSTADSAPDVQAVTVDKCAAGAVSAVQGAELKWDTRLSGAVPAVGPAGLFGSMGSVDDLLGALRRATGESRRGTADSAPDVPAGTGDTAGAAVLRALASQKVEEAQKPFDTATAAPAAAAEPAGLHGNLSSVDDLIQALRSATGDGRPDTTELVLDTGAGAAAAIHLLQQQQQQDEVGRQQLQQSMAASDSVRRSSLSSCSSFEDVLGALLRATADSRRGTAEAVAEAAAVPLDLQLMQQQQQQPRAGWQTQFTPGDKQPCTAGCSPGHMSGSSISALVTSLRRLTAETQGQYKTAAEALSPLPPQPGAVAAANTPAAAAAAGSADMRELVAALRRVTGEDHMAGCSNAGPVHSVAPNRLVLTPQAGSQALSYVRHKQEQQQQQQQHAALIQQLLLHTQPGQFEEQLSTQQHRGSGSYFKAAWGSSGGEETPAASAGGAAVATCSRGVEQLLAALRHSTVSSGVPAAHAADSWLCGEAAQHAKVDCAASKTSAELLAVLLQGQQQHLQQQQAASAIQELKVFGANSSCTPDSTAALLDILPAEHAAAASAQQQDHPRGTAQLSVSQSPLRARQLWHAEASPGAAGGCNQPELGLSQLVHALQSTGIQLAGGEPAEALNPSASAAYTAATAAAVAAGANESEDFAEAFGVVAAAAADTLPDDADGHSDECRFPTTTPHEEEQLPAAAEPPQQQKQQQQYQQAAAESPQQQPAAAAPAPQLLQEVVAGAAAESSSQQQQAACSTKAEAAAVPQQQQQQQEHSMPAVAAGSTCNPPDQQASAAATGLQSCVSSIAVAFDHRLPAELRIELAAAVAAAGGRVVPGQPHLGCGADTVVAEPQHAAQWLQLLMHIVSPAWLLKACMQQQQQGCRAHQQLMCLSPDVARALGQGGQQQGGHTGVQQHAGAVAGAEDSEPCAAGGGINHCSSAITLETHSTAAAYIRNSSGPVAATAHEPGNCTGSSSSRACRAVLAVPGVLSVDGMGLCGVSAAAGTAAGDAGQLQQQPLLMPPGLLEGVVWSVDQDPRSIDDEEAEAVILQGTASSITLLLPQDSSGLLGHASVLVSACQPCKGLTCSDVLQAIHSFYQQEVLLQQQLQQQPAVAAAAAAAAAGVNASASNGEKYCEWQVHEQGGVVVRRLQLLGARLMLEGLVRATRDPCSCVYEVCLA